MAASFTKLTSSPDMLRYFVYDVAGAFGKYTVTQLLGDLNGVGPLAQVLKQSNAAGSWGANSAAIGSPNPAINPKISVTLTDYTGGSGSITGGSSYQWYNDGSANVIGVLGGPRSDIATTVALYTSAILEIRFNHSISR
jgi:hypothetical protein